MAVGRKLLESRELRKSYAPTSGVFVTGGRKFTAVDGVSFFGVMIVPGWGAAVLRLSSR